MKCEYCDSYITDVPDNRICPNCGSTMRTKPPIPPFSMVEAQGGFVEMNTQGIRLCVKHPRKPRMDIMIPYNEIFNASYVPANLWHNGFLCVREKKKQYIPLPKKFGQHRLGDTVAFFDEKKNGSFFQVYLFLKKITDTDAM